MNEKLTRNWVRLRRPGPEEPESRDLKWGTLLWAARQTQAGGGAGPQGHGDRPQQRGGIRAAGDIAVRRESEPDEALEAYNKVIELKPNDSAGYLNRGVLYASMKKDAEAEADFKKAIALNPKNLEAYSNLSRFYQYKQDPARPNRYCRKASRTIRMLPANYLRLAAMLLQQNRTADAETVIRNLRNQLPKNADVAGAIAEFYMAARNPDAAIKEYQRGLQIDPKNERLQMALAETYLMTGHIDEATKLDEQILKGKPNDVAGRMIKGRLEAIKGDFAAAVVTLRRGGKERAGKPAGDTTFWDRRC